MKIVIDGVEYIAMPAGKNFMKYGAREISRRYNECPKFFDAILQKGFSYFERDEESAFSMWATDDGVVYLAHDIDIVSEWKPEERCFYEYRYKDIRSWNLPEFTEHIEESHCICQYNAASATALLLQHGPAYTYAQLNATDNLKPEEVVEHQVIIQ